MPGTRKLGRDTAHRTAMLRGLVTFFLENGKIETTVTRAKEVRALADELGELIGLSPAVLAPVLKTVGIAILTRIAAELCRDAGEGGIAAAAETAGAAAAVLTALPLLRAVLSTITGLL